MSRKGHRCLMRDVGVGFSWRCWRLPESALPATVSMIDVMHHVPPSFQKEFLLTACRHVRPSGLLIYKDMCRRPRWRAAANRLHDLVLARQWINYLPISQVELWAGEAA